MRPLNEKGQVVVFFVFLAPIFVLLLVMTAEFSRLVYLKMKLQGTADQALFAGASYLTEVFNSIARSNRKVHQEFLDLEEKYRRASERSEGDAKKELEKTWNNQNKIFDVEMKPLLDEAYAKAYALALQVARQNFSGARLVPLYEDPPAVGEGRTRELSFHKIEGIVFDPRGHRRVPPSDRFEARVAFVKDYKNKVALAAGLEAEAPRSIFSFLQPGRPLRAVAAAQPYGGSIWEYALQPSKARLYRTTMVPLKSLPAEGFLPWENFYADEIEH